MDRRLYFLIPDRKHAIAVVEELLTHGIGVEHMHAIGDPRTRLDGLPVATAHQRNDDGQRVEKIFWNANLVCFALAVIALVAMPAIYGMSWWLLIPTTVVLATFMIGLRFTHVPNTHLGEFRDALAHGEILLLVDVPESQVAEVETDIHHHHPEATVGGAGWSTQAFGL